MNPDAPPGFEKLREGFGFADVLQPLYRRAGDTPAMGMYVRERHINTLGICHGGVLMTLAGGKAAPFSAIFRCVAPLCASTWRKNGLAFPIVSPRTPESDRLPARISRQYAPKYGFGDTVEAQIATLAR